MFLPERLRSLLPKKKTKEELDRHYDEVELEKGDFLAMVIAAVITFFPVLIVVFAVLAGLLWLLFLR
jgi:hypothetical protein